MKIPWLHKTFGPPTGRPAEEGPEAERQLCGFLLYMFGAVFFSTSGDEMNLMWLPLLENLPRLGSYNWGGAVLAHLMAQMESISEGPGLLVRIRRPVDGKPSSFE